MTRPGGWIELVEVDPLFKNQGPATRRMLDLIIQACGKRGIDLSIAHKLEALVKATGVIDVQSRVISIPVGDWGGRLGTMAKADFYAGNKTIAPLVATATEATMEEYYRLADAWMQECEQYQTYCNFHVIYGLRQAQ